MHLFFKRLYDVLLKIFFSGCDDVKIEDFPALALEHSKGMVLNVSIVGERMNVTANNKADN